MLIIMLKLLSNKSQLLSRPHLNLFLYKKWSAAPGLAGQIFFIAVITLFTLLISCAGSGGHVSSTSGMDNLKDDQNSKIKIYSNDAPPDNYELLDLITVEHNDKNERYRLAREQVRKLGGDALIVKPENKETTSEFRQTVDLRRPGGFSIKKRGRTVISQDFLVIKLKKQSASKTTFTEPLDSGPVTFAEIIDSTPSRSTGPAPQENENPPKKSAPTGPFRDNGNGTILQKGDNLLWQKCSAGQELTATSCAGSASSLNADDGRNYCRNLHLANKEWRLPTKKEMELLIEKSKSLEESNEFISGEFFPSTPASAYWTSSSYLSEDGIGRYVIDFSSGRNFTYFDDSSAHVRCMAIQPE